jgi:hypothetical protein
MIPIFFLHLSMDDCHFGYKQKFLKQTLGGEGG